jgi:hypothetical protein
MWHVIVGVMSLGLGILALIGLLAVAKELFREGSLDIHFTDAGRAMDRHDFGGAHGRHRVMTP